MTILAKSIHVFDTPDQSGPDNVIMFMPGGDHVIVAERNGAPARVTVRVTAADADKMSEQLRALKARSEQRPFFDFDHENKAASAWPLEFIWREFPRPGIYAKVEWSEAGRSAVTGRTHRAFSPVFHVDESSTPATIIANSRATLNLGGLVNDPAFAAMLPIWAKRAGDL